MDRDAVIAEAHLENALMHYARRVQTQGLCACENQDCSAPISDARQAMGARLCVPCATAEEQMKCHFSQVRR